MLRNNQFVISIWGVIKWNKQTEDMRYERVLQSLLKYPSYEEAPWCKFISCREELDLQLCAATPPLWVCMNWRQSDRKVFLWHLSDLGYPHKPCKQSSLIEFGHHWLSYLNVSPVFNKVPHCYCSTSPNYTAAQWSCQMIYMPNLKYVTSKWLKL